MGFLIHYVSFVAEAPDVGFSILTGRSIDRFNLQGTNDAVPFGEVSEQGYYKKLAEAYNIAMRHSKPKGSLTVDCANGVGAISLRNMVDKYLPGESEQAGGIKINVVNEDIKTPAKLNEKCGADFS